MKSIFISSLFVVITQIGFSQANEKPLESYPNSGWIAENSSKDTHIEETNQSSDCKESKKKNYTAVKSIGGFLAATTAIMIYPVVKAIKDFSKRCKEPINLRFDGNS